MTFNTYVDLLPSAAANIDDNIDLINEQITELNTQISDIKTNVLTPMVSASDNYLDDKAAALTISLGETITSSAGSTYGLMTDYTHNITDWALVSGAGVPGQVWTPSNIGPGGPTQIDIDQDNLQTQYDTTIDHLYRTFETTPIGTYGIEANKDSLSDAIDILESDRDKLLEVYSIYDEYT